MTSDNRQMSQQPTGGGMQGFPFLGMQQGSQPPGMQQMPGMGGGQQMSGMGMPQMPSMGGQQMPGMGMSQMPSMGGQQMPGMGMSQFPGMGMQQGPGMQSFPSTGNMLPVEQSYIENILRLNRGKLATVYMTFEGAQHKSFTGIVEAAGRDHIILSDPDTGMRYLLLMVYVDYVTFPEEIEYNYPFGQLSTYSPR